MITLRDKIEQFKRDMRSLRYYEGKIKEIENELIKLSRIMHEPKAIHYGEHLGGTAVSYLELMEQEQSLKNELKMYSSTANKTKKLLEKLSGEERDTLEQLYVKRKGFTYMASKLHVSERKLKYDVDGIIKKIV